MVGSKILETRSRIFEPIHEPSRYILSYWSYTNSLYQEPAGRQGVWVRQQRRNGQQDFTDSQRGTPLVL